MKKIFLTILLLAAAYNMSFATSPDNDPCRTFTMPPENVLKERFQTGGFFKYFDEKTNLSKKLGNKEINPFGVANAVTIAIVEFNEEIDYDKLNAEYAQLEDQKERLLKNCPLGSDYEKYAKIINSDFEGRRREAKQKHTRYNKEDMSVMMVMDKPMLIKALLVDNPEAIECLKTHKILE